MTENTQTTAERIGALLGNYIDINGDVRDGFYDGAVAPIAAEIDRLTADLGAARAKLKECDDSTDFVQDLREAEQATLSNTQRLLGVAHTELAEARAERDEAQKGWAHYQSRAEIAEGERDRYARDAALMCAVWNSYRDLLPGVRAELAAARAKVADWEHKEGLAEIANTQINLHYAEVAKNRELTAQLAAALAEVERLLPAAEAFGWWENYASNANTTTWDIFQTAAQRARDLSFVEFCAVILDDYQIDALKRGIASAANETQP